MFFGSYTEFVLIVAFTLVYNLVRWLIPTYVTFKKVLLLLGSFVILSLIIDKNTLFVLSLLMAGTYALAKVLQSQELANSKRRKILVSTLSFLVFLFCVRNYPWIQNFLSRYGVENTVNSISLVGRVGLSYILFRLLHFLVDAYRLTLNRLDLISFFNYIFFFPTYLSGPIDRYNNFSFWEERHKAVVELDLIVQGFARLFIGSIKKFMIVPFLLPYVNEISSFDAVTSSWQLQMALTVLAYSFYIYFDFSGYSDIAIGSAYLLGIRTPENFNNPYFSKDIAEFWKRWHISFSSILGEYVFKPIVVGFTKRFPNSPRLRISIIGYMLTFFICGIWHGSTLNFVYWGLWHGLGLSAFKIWQKVDLRLPFIQPIRNILAVLVTFSFVTVGWYFFMTPTNQIHMVVKNEVDMFNSEYSSGSDISLKIHQHYWKNYGWGIKLEYTGDPAMKYDIALRPMLENSWKTIYKGREGKYDHFDIHGSETFNGEKRNMKPGLYLVRIKEQASTEWYGDIVLIQDYVRNED